MRERILSRLVEDGWLPAPQAESVRRFYAQRHFALEWELRLILYLGVMLLSTGIGMLVYFNIDTLGHQVVIAAIAAGMAACFAWCYRKKPAFQWEETRFADAFSDYVLLLGCLLFLALEGYLQFQYTLFGERYGLATLLPAALFFFLAYYFDHRGVLGMGITSLAAWLGLAVKPAAFFEADLEEPGLIYAALGLGATLALAAYLSEKERLKPHFSFTYLHFSVHLLLLSAFTGMVTLPYGWAFIFIMALGVWGFIRYARQTQSFYFLLAAILYGYATVTYLFFTWVDAPGMDTFQLGMLYFMISCGAIIYFLFNYKRFLRP